MMDDNEKEEKVRTLRQNRSLHKWCEEVSSELNNAGVDMLLLIKEVPISHSPESVKMIYRSIGKVKFGKESTADLSTSEINGCYEEMVRMLGVYGISVSFPSQEDTDSYLNSFHK